MGDIEIRMFGRRILLAWGSWKPEEAGEEVRNTSGDFEPANGGEFSEDEPMVFGFGRVK